METTNSRGVEIIKFSESLHDGDLTYIGLQPKMCPRGIWTVGWGHALIDPVTKKFLKGDADKEKAYSMYPCMTEEEANELLKTDLISREKDVIDLKLNLNNNQFSAIVSFVFNLGIGNLKKSTLIKLIKVNSFDERIKNEFPKWNKSAGVIQPGLIKRRKSECDLYFS